MQLHAECFFFNLDETSDIYHTISHSFILSIQSNSLSSHPKNLSHANVGESQADNLGEYIGFSLLFGIKKS